MGRQTAMQHTPGQVATRLVTLASAIASRMPLRLVGPAALRDLHVTTTIEDLVYPPFHIAFPLHPHLHLSLLLFSTEYHLIPLFTYLVSTV
jgi:hypothetical protein